MPSNPPLAPARTRITRSVQEQAVAFSRWRYGHDKVFFVTRLEAYLPHTPTRAALQLRFESVFDELLYLQMNAGRRELKAGSVRAAVLPETYDQLRAAGEVLIGRAWVAVQAMNDLAALLTNTFRPARLVRVNYLPAASARQEQVGWLRPFDELITSFRIERKRGRTVWLSANSSAHPLILCEYLERPEPDWTRRDIGLPWSAREHQQLVSLLDGPLAAHRLTLAALLPPDNELVLEP